MLAMRSVALTLLAITLAGCATQQAFVESDFAVLDAAEQIELDGDADFTLGLATLICDGYETPGFTYERGISALVRSGMTRDDAEYFTLKATEAKCPTHLPDAKRGSW